MAQPSADTATSTIPGGATVTVLPIERARWLALCGAVLWLCAAWAPWAIFIRQGPIAVPEPYIGPAAFGALTPARALAPMLQPVLWGIITPLGLLICPWLWSRRFRVVAVWAYATWTALITLGTLLALAALGALIARSRFTLMPYQGAGIALDFGLPLALGTLALCWLAVRSLVPAARDFVRRDGWRRTLRGGQRLRAGYDAPAALHARAGLSAGGAGTITAGVLIWALAYLFMPWVLAPCAQTGVISGCLGVSGSGAMEVAAASATAWVDPRIFVYAMPILLVGSAVMTVYAVQRLQVNARLCIWLALWLALASATVALGLAGAAEVVARGGVGGMAHVTEVPAGPIAGLGVALGWLGLIPLVIAVYSERRDPATSA